MIVPQSETQIIERLGKYHRTLPSGINIIWPILDKPREMYYRYIETDVNGKQYVRNKLTKKIDLRELIESLMKGTRVFVSGTFSEKRKTNEKVIFANQIQ